MADELDAVAQRHMRADRAEGANDDIGADPGGRIDHGHGMNAAQGSSLGQAVDRGNGRPGQDYSEMIIAPSSASAQITPATLASPLNHHMFLRRLIRLM